MCCDWDPDPSNILEKDSYIFQDCNYNSTIVNKEKHMVSKSVLLVTDTVFRAEMWRRIGRTETSLRITVVLFCSYKLQKTLPVTMLLLCGHATLLCETFFLFCWVKDLFSYHTVNTIRSTSLHAPGLSIHTGLVHQCPTSDTSSGGTSEVQRNFTPHRIWNFNT